MATPLLGQLIYAAFGFAPIGYATASGQILSIAQNTALFAILGTSYGGDGTSTYALPDLQGRMPVHPGGPSQYVLGQQAGAETVTLTSDNLPAHTHVLFASSSNAKSQIAQTDYMLAKAVSAGGTMLPQIYAPASSTNAGLDDQTLNAAGNGLPSTLVQPYLAINCCVALQGIFPARN